MATRGIENEIPPSPPQLPPWIELPQDVTANILGRLRIEEILENAQKVCTTWWKVCKDPAMWRVVHLTQLWKTDRDINLMCRCAVDRSQGQLTDLSIACFGDDELLNYVANRSNHLRCLTITDRDFHYYISLSALVEVVQKLPKLEELHLTGLRSWGSKDVETIGIACPLLKSFTCEIWGLNCNSIALAIAKTMPNLHHLRITGDRMENKELEAILDGCPYLELLDLSGCDGVDLRGALAERCSKQIKFMTINDFWWEDSHYYRPEDDLDDI